jgi:hypothetical protein
MKMQKRAVPLTTGWHLNYLIYNTLFCCLFFTEIVCIFSLQDLKRQIEKDRGEREGGDRQTERETKYIV